jgi:hypothetical protein
VLDFMVEVAVERPATFEEIETVLGFDWGVRVLVTASVVDLDGKQIGRPFFLDTGPFDGRQARLRRQIDQRKRQSGPSGTATGSLSDRRSKAPTKRGSLADFAPGDQSRLSQVRSEK